MCAFNHDEAKGSQATILIIIQCLCGLIRRSGLIHFDWDLEILALNSLQAVVVLYVVSSVQCVTSRNFIRLSNFSLSSLSAATHTVFEFAQIHFKL